MSSPDRPGIGWRCGIEDEGECCSTGPTPRGACPGAAECRPMREGDRWLCNRSPARGGPCDHETPGGGPTPEGLCCLRRACRPRLTLRAIRARWSAYAVVLAIGLGMLFLGARSRNEWIVPGRLTSQHAAVVARDATRCSACHPNANDSAGKLLTQAALGDASRVLASGHEVSQSTLCLDCHRELAGPHAEPMLAHGLAAEVLGEHANGQHIACAVCHQEHHGADHDLTMLSDARCQSCHQKTYESFATDHPDFGLWPSRRRTRIAFNHGSHVARHYPQANRSFDCAACHLADATGDLTQRVDYTVGCADCHDAELRKSLESGVPLVVLPMLDEAALAETDRPIGSWPAEALGDFDGDAPVLMKLLLAADPDALEAMRRLGFDFTFFDIDPDDPNQAKLGAVLAESLRRLLDELQEEGHNHVAYRLRTLLGDRADTAAVADLVRGLPAEFVDQTQAVWFNGAPRPAEFDAVEDRRAAGGWWVDHQDLSIRYRPSGHEDPFLRAWLDLIVALPPELKELRDACLLEFTRTGAPGGCLTCHSVERDGADGLTLNWRGRDRLSEPKGFTRFSHRPHLIQPELASCTHCHTIDPTADLSASYASTDPTHFTPQFVLLSKAACAECHRPQAAGDRCTQCHGYHVERDLVSAKRTLPGD